MPWQLSDDVDRYDAAAGDLLRRDPLRHTIGLTVVVNAHARTEALPEPELYGWWTEPDGTVSGAWSLTAPHPVVVEAAPPHTRRALVDHLVVSDALRRRFSGINAASDLAVELAALWTAATGGSATLTWAQRLFALDGLRTPDPLPPGGARVAEEADRPLLTRWGAGFAEAVGASGRESVVDSVLRRFEARAVHLWCLPDGTPVSMAGRTEPAGGVVRVGPVFTPADHRGHGYGGAVTAAASSAALDVADGVVLFTDLANPTSNALYPRLGYRAVGDRAVFALDPPG